MPVSGALEGPVTDPEIVLSVPSTAFTPGRTWSAVTVTTVAELRLAAPSYHWLARPGDPALQVRAPSSTSYRPTARPETLYCPFRAVLANESRPPGWVDTP